MRGVEGKKINGGKGYNSILIKTLIKIMLPIPKRIQMKLI